MAVTPQNLLANFAQGQAIQAQREERAQRREDRERESATRNRLAQMLSGGMPTTPEAQRQVVGAVAQGDPAQALQWAEYFKGQQPDRIKRYQAEAPVFVSQLQGVRDQATYDAAKANLARLGADVSDMPDAYDPMQVNATLQGYRYLAEGPPEAKGGGPFEGTGLQAQAANLLLTADPSSAEYAMAYRIMSQPRTYMDQSSGQIVSVSPDMSGVQPPAGAAGASPAAAPSGQPRPEIPTPSQPEAPEPMGTPKGSQITQTQQRSRISATPVPGTGPRLTEGQKARDREFGKEYVGWTGGGQADAEKNLSQLEAQIQRLESGENLTGPVIGRQPRAIAEIATPGAVDVQEQVEEVVQRNLREILGAQFTEREGERLISRAFNPRLDEATNAARLRRLATQMRKAAEAKSAMASYFDQYGTLQGYSGPEMPTMSQIGDAVEETGRAAAEEPEAMDFRNMSDEELRKLVE